MKELKGKKVRITKLVDDFEQTGETHPNGFVKGSVIEGTVWDNLVVGERFIVGRIGTSRVTKIIDNTTFKTIYSTYKLEILD